LEHPSRSSLDVQAEVYLLPQSDYEDNFAMITDGEKTTKTENSEITESELSEKDSRWLGYIYPGGLAWQKGLPGRMACQAEWLAR
jgi:hypothetical protein